jgi:hypothetical protein
MKTIINLRTVRNPKARRSGTGVLVPTSDGKALEWRSALKRTTYGGDWEFEVGELFVLVYDDSSHKNSRKMWRLERAQEGRAEELGVRLYRTNRFWEARFFDREGNWRLVLQIASQFKGVSPSKLDTISAINAFFLAAIEELRRKEEGEEDVEEILPKVPGVEYRKADSIILVSRSDVPGDLHPLDFLANFEIPEDVKPEVAVALSEQAKSLRLLAERYLTLARLLGGVEEVEE